MTAMTTDFATIRATVPEHSTAFMAAMSGGTPFVEDGFLFFSGSGESDVAPWLTAVAYPLADELPAPQDAPHGRTPLLAGRTCRAEAPGALRHRAG